MIKIYKPREEKDIPGILNDAKTQKQRKQLIRAKKWSWSKRSSTFKTPFLQDDVRTALMNIYHEKCAYCEQHLGIKQKDKPHFSNSLTVEHYRPKALYRWLAYSWDNLLAVCYTCNHEKANNFVLKGIQITAIRDGEIEDIHQLAAKYNAEELPLFIHPELEDVSDLLTFDINGGIDSEDERCNYVIDICKLNVRVELRRERKKIWDDMITEYETILLETSEEELENEVELFFTKIIQKLQNPITTFMTCQTYYITHFSKLLNAV